jgi:acyl carrier protein
MPDTNRTKLIDIVATILELDPGQVTDDLSPQKAQSWDSLNHLNICVAIGQEFGLELTTEQMLAIHSVGDIVQFLRAAGIHCG